jgi:two-component system, chemotaxis family, protein-glutamate methylesterase/glutaminase
MKPLRILIVDDSAVARRSLSDFLASDPEIVVAGTAGNGIHALARIAEVKPDLVTLDIEMPKMGALEILVEIRKRYTKLPVIIFCSLAKGGAAAILDALARGASDYVTKPSNGGIELFAVREELLRKIKSLCAARVPQPWRAPTTAPVYGHSQSRIDVLAIGTSAGGPNALTALIPELPADFPVPIVIVQHMPPLFTRLLADRLNALSRLQVREGEDGQKLRRGQVWIAPGDHHMTVAREGAEFVLGINHDAQENSCRPAVDVLFRSVAQSYGARALAVVLTGMGTDGTRGSVAIREAGGEVIVQDEGSSVVWGMPGSVVAANLADRTYPLDEMARKVVRRVSMRGAFASSAGR